MTTGRETTCTCCGAPDSKPTSREAPDSHTAEPPTTIPHANAPTATVDTGARATICVAAAPACDAIDATRAGHAGTCHEGRCHSGRCTAGKRTPGSRHAGRRITGSRHVGTRMAGRRHVGRIAANQRATARPTRGGRTVALFGSSSERKNPSGSSPDLRVLVGKSLSSDVIRGGVTIAQVAPLLRFQWA
jgi:hypothetical protein